MKNIHLFIKLFVLQCFMTVTFLPQISKAQISINDNQTAAALASSLLGGGVSISSATLSCNGISNGIFTVSSSNLGLDNGIILTCGRAMTSSLGLGANGTGTSGAPSTAVGSGSDPDLALLTAPQSSQDKCVLEFDFVPLTDSIKFQYVFSSVEYTNFTCQFADVFGFFLSGPGITGPFSNNAKNIALVPGTTCPVGVNTINAGVGQTQCGNFVAPCINNSIYWVNNQTGTTVSHNGFTTVLNARSQVTPNQTHHIKLAICDAGDQVLDSGVWLKQGSFTSATQTVVNCGPYTWPVNGVTYTATGVYTYTPPTGPIQILDLTIFCPNTVPTMSEWGLILVSLISLSFGMIFLYKKETALAIAGSNNLSTSNKSSLFHAALYFRVLAVILGIAILGLFLSFLYYSELTVTDTVGSVLSAMIIAYMVHLYLLIRFKEK